MRYWLWFHLLLLCVVIIECSKSSKKKKKNTKPKLYGSQDAEEGQFPYMVLHILRTRRAYHTCSGALLSQDWVLSAAHCLNKEVLPRNHIVVAGRADLRDYARARYRGMPFYRDIDETAFGVQERRAGVVFFHPLHTRGGNNDVGLIRVDRPFVLNGRVSSLSIARDPFQERSDCTLSGFGLVENDIRRYILQYITTMPARPARQCRYQRMRDVICLGDTTRGICHGDSGGPLVCGGLIRGVASHGVSREQGCGRGTVEQYYTDTERNLAWIDSVRNSTRKLTSPLSRQNS